MFLLALVCAAEGRAEVSLSEMARLQAKDAAGAADTQALVRGYLSLGLVREAATVLERRVRVGTFPRQAAMSLFEEVAAAQGRFDDPGKLLTVCEAAIRSGAASAPVLYEYGSALRGIPGRLADASATLARVGTEAPYGSLALYSLGQIAASRGETRNALELFRRVETETGGLAYGGPLTLRAGRSRAELLLAEGRAAEARQVFDTLTRRGSAPLDRIGSAAAGADPARALEELPAEMVAGMPVEDRVRFLLLVGGIARESGRYAEAIGSLDRAGKELDETLALASPPSSEVRRLSQRTESLRVQLESLRTARQRLLAVDPSRADSLGGGALDLLVGLLLADRTAALAARETAFSGPLRLLSRDDVEEIVRRIEEVSLDGIEVDRLVAQSSATLDTFQNMAHPIRRYRRLVQLEGSQEEVHRLRDRIQTRREATVEASTSGGDEDLSALLNDIGLFLQELDAIRKTAAELHEFQERYFDILQRNRPAESTTETPGDRATRGAIEYADGWVMSFLPIAGNLAAWSGEESWKRRVPGLVALRGVADRQLADTLVEHARLLRREAGETPKEESRKAFARAVSLLSGGRLSPADKTEVALRIASAIAEGTGTWEPYPGEAADEKEKEWIARVLPLLPGDDSPVATREAGLYLGAVLRYAVKDPAAPAFAKRYLQRYPASPLSAEIGIRLGHEALLAGDAAGAAARYRAAARAGRPAASAVARYMLAWIRYQSGDAEAALEELSSPLSASSFSCENPSPFERAALSLSVRAGEDVSAAQLEEFPPVRKGTCAGKAFLFALWEAQEKRGRPMLAAKVRDIASRRYPADADAAALEVETVATLLRSGKEDEALSRALTLRARFGPGSEWAKSQTEDVQKKACADLAETFKIIGNRKFDQGIRTKEHAAFTAAATMMTEYLQLNAAGVRGQDDEIRLRLAVALLGSGDRSGGVRILREMAGERRRDATGERAALLYAETMIEACERKEATAADAENAARLLLDVHPSPKAASLALRASSAFLAAREYDRARRTAQAVESAQVSSPEQAREARLLQSEAAVFEGDFAGAREKADFARTASVNGDGQRSSKRAEDLYLLASLKEVEEMASAGNAKGAAASLEHLVDRYPGAPERPIYLLRSMRLLAQDGDADGAIRTALRFLEEYPRRQEALEATAVVGPLLEAKGEFAAAGNVYERAAGTFPKSDAAPRMLFHAARLAELHGPAEAAARRFASWRATYAVPDWRWAYATLYVGLDGWRDGPSKKSVRLMEEGLRRVDDGIEEDGAWEVAELAGKARIAVGENWAEQFRGTRLVVPLDKSLAIKDRLFRRALASYKKAGSDAPLETAVQADLLSADLLMDYGRAILASQRPKGLQGAERDGYEEALKSRAKEFFEGSVEWSAGALDRLDEGNGPSDLAVPIRRRLEEAQLLLERTVPGRRAEMR